MADVMVLSPSEFEGEVGTAVAGRVVLARRSTVQQRQQQGKGKGKKAGGGKEGKGETVKCELHVLGGSTMADMLFVDAWGDDAVNLHKIAERGRIIKIVNPRVIDQRPQYSSSPLRYFLRVKAPLNNLTGTRVEVMTQPPEPWSTIPQNHPFVEIADLERVDDNATLCVLVVVVAQPGKVSRMSSYGAADVCNAVVRQKATTIRCAFWRRNADALSEFPVGTCVAMYQVRVVKVADSDWELRATESTVVERCPSDLEERVRGETNLEEEASQALTRSVHGAKDYDSCSASPACVGSMMSLLMTDAPRTMDGVWELHCVTALGLSPVLNDEAYHMSSCVECKRQVDETNGSCNQHPEAKVERRWIGRLAIADDTGNGEAMIYHEALTESGLLPSTTPESLSPAQLLALRRKARGTPWSVRLVYRMHEARQQNYIEIKKIAPLLTNLGVVATWRVSPVPEVLRGSICPLVKCAAVRHDAGLGATFVSGREVTVLRLWVRILEPAEDEEVAVPDATAKGGLRVRRQIRCAADPADEQVYTLQQSGLSSGVQWLMSAPADSVFLILASKKGSEAVFVASGYLNISTVHGSTARQVLTATLDRKRGAVLTTRPTDTPLKRKQALDDAMPMEASPAEGVFSGRKTDPLG